MKKLFIIPLLFIAILFASCNKVNENTRSITYVDTNYMVKEDIKKAVVLDLGFLDIINELGIDVELSIPNTTLPSYLSKYEAYKTAGSIKTPSVEDIVNFDPDIILIGGRQESYITELSKIQTTIMVTGLDTESEVDLVKRNIDFACDLFKVSSDKNDELINTLNNQINLTKEEATKFNNAGGNVLFVMYNDGFSVYGSGSRFDIIFSTLGLNNADPSIVSSTHGQTATPEYILEKNPKMIFVLDRTKITGTTGSNIQTIFAPSTFDNLYAKQKNTIYEVDSVIWYLVSGGYRSVLMQVQEVNNFVTSAYQVISQTV